MCDCSTNAWRVPTEREPGVIYQHGLYDAAMIAHVSAIEVDGVRFTREQSTTLAEIDALTQTLSMVNICAWAECSACGCLTPDDSLYCMQCGAKVVDE